MLSTDQREESKSSRGEVQINRERVWPSTPPMMTPVTYMENAENGITFPKKDGLNNSHKEFPTLQNSEVVPFTDKDIVHHSPPSVSMVEASDVHGTLNISVSVPHEEQDVTATIVTTSLLENNNIDSRSSDNGKFLSNPSSASKLTKFCILVSNFSSSNFSGEAYPAEVPQQLVTTQTFDFHHDEPIRTGICSAVVDAPAGQG